MDEDTKSNGASARLERLLASPAGQRLARSLEESAAQAEAVVAPRRRAAAALQQARRRRREEFPELSREHAEARSAMEVARRAYKDAIRSLAAAGRRLDGLLFELNDAEVRARRELEGTADPRVREALARIDEALRDRRLMTPKTESVEVLVDPDPSDPDRRAHLALGRKYRMTRRGSNAPGLIEIRGCLEAARRALQALLLEPEVPEDLEVRLSRYLALCSWTQPPMVWHEPSPPRFNARGEQIA